VKILVVNWKDNSHKNAGGAEEYVSQLCLNWGQQGHEVFLLTSIHLDHEICSGIEKTKIVHRGGKYTAHVLLFLEVKKLMHTLNFDLVIEVVNTIPFFFVSKVARKQKNLKFYKLIFQTAEEIWDFQTPWPISKLGRLVLEPTWMRIASKNLIATISQSSADSFRRFGVDDSLILPIGNDKVDVSPIHQNRTEFRKDLVFCARLVKMKQPVDAIQGFLIAKELSIHLDESVLHIVGDGEELRSLQKNFIHRKDVIFHGYVSSEARNQIYEKSRVILATSVREGWGLTVTEAARLGVIPVGYDAPGLRDSIKFSGGVVTSTEPKSLAIGIIKAFDDLSFDDFCPEQDLDKWEIVSKNILSAMVSTSTKSVADEKR
jgi:glycosyltransferase involved in cell wall biosynthesis